MKKNYMLIIFILLLLLSTGFAFLTANLDVNGTIAFKDSVWDVHLDNVIVENDSADADNPTINNDKDTVNFTVSFTRPGDYYEFYVDVVNAGTMDATLDSVEKTTLIDAYGSNLIYNVSYYSDRELSEGDLLRSGCKERIKVRVEYKYDVDSYTQLDDLSFYFTVNYIKADTHTSTYNNKIWNFDSKAEEDTFVVPKTGIYKLEVWGAQGASYSDSKQGGYGGYSVGDISLTKAATLYINVGEEGKMLYTAVNDKDVSGGYNGGGSSSSGVDNRNVSSGGGATHISFQSGLLYELSDARNKVIIVAGGGGGRWFFQDIDKTQLGHGGGYIGNTTQTTFSLTGSNTYDYIASGGGQDSSGEYGIVFGEFGKAAESGSKTGYGGAGGGWYGGNTRHYAGSGGSGYIGNSSLTNKIMYCYSCQSSSEEDDETDIKTRSTTNVSETATSKSAKSGHGYARITYID